MRSKVKYPFISLYLSVIFRERTQSYLILYETIVTSLLQKIILFYNEYALKLVCKHLDKMYMLDFVLGNIFTVLISIFFPTVFSGLLFIWFSMEYWFKYFLHGQVLYISQLNSFFFLLTSHIDVFMYETKCIIA